jgi:hypothetical protein
MLSVSGREEREGGGLRLARWLYGGDRRVG